MKRIIIFLLVVLFAGCAVVNVYVTFPEEKIKKAAEDILAPAPSSPSGFLKYNFTKNLYADEKVVVGKELKTDSPVIRQAQEKINSWRSKLDEFKKDGYIGETNDFKVVIKQVPDDKQKETELRELVKNENTQRDIIIKELMKINNAPAKEEKKFREIFAETSIKYSPSGTWIQDAKGNWKRK